MNHPLMKTAPSYSQDVIDELLAEGCAIEDIEMAISHQQLQKGQGKPVLPLRQILGLQSRTEQGPSLASIITPSMKAMKRRFQRANASKSAKQRGGLHITGAKVWRHSVEEGGEEERAFIQRPTPSYTAMMNKVVALMDGLGRDMARIKRRKIRELNEHEHYISLFNDAERRVLRFLIDQQAYFKGQCSPSIAYIAQSISRCERTVYNALKRLQLIGLVEWLRRKVIVSSDTHQPTAEQTSNIYRCVLPKWLATILKIKPIPLPDDLICHSEKRFEDLAIMIADTDLSERERILPGDPALAAEIIAAAMRLDNRAGLNVAVIPDCKIHDRPPSNNIYR